MRKLIPLALLVVAVLGGCTGGSGETNEETPKAKAPDVTPEQAAKNLEKSNAPPAAKKMMGGAMNQNGGAGADAGKE